MTGVFSPVNPADWVSMAARRTPGATCLIRPDNSILTYREVAADVARLAGALAAAGLVRGDQIAAIGTDSVEYLELVLASMRIGATVVPLNFRLAGTEIDQILQLVSPAAFFADVRYEHVADAAAESIGRQLKLVAGIDAALSNAPGVRDLIRRADDVVDASRCRDEDILVIGLTSGTTGRPKAVLQSQRMLKAIVTNNVIETGLTPQDRLYSGAPLFHVAGLGNALCGLARGCAIVLLAQFNAADVLHRMRSGQLTFCVLMPTMISALLDQPEVRRGPYESLRGIMYGGAAMPVDLLRDMAVTFGCDLYNGFGAGTEAGGQAMLQPADHRRAFAGDDRLLGSIGRPMYGVELKVCDPSGVEVPDGVVGEIFTRSDAVMSGYLDAPELTDQRLKDGWFHGGDLAWRDEEGYLFLAGRQDDMFIRGGENIFPAEIERIVTEHPGVADVAVIGAPDPHWGAVVVAYVVLRPGFELALEDLRAFCRDRLASYKVPEALHVVDALPKNATGKVLRRRLAEVPR